MYIVKPSQPDVRFRVVKNQIDRRAQIKQKSFFEKHFEQQQFI